MTNSGVPDAQLILDLTKTDLDTSTNVYFYIVGLVGNDYYYLDNDFTPQLMTASDNTEATGTFPGMDNYSQDIQNALEVNYPLAWADWGIEVGVGSNLILNLGNISTSNIPNLGTGTSAFSGRIYVSVGVPQLPFTVQVDKVGNVNGYTAPVFGDGSGVGGSLTLFDWIEFSYDCNGAFNGNTTQVNQFGFPLSLKGIDTSKVETPVQGELNTSRTAILADLATNIAAPFGASEVMVEVPAVAKSLYPDNVKYIRAISPVTSSATTESIATTLNSYFDADIATAYSGWQGTPLIATDTSSGSFTGVVYPLAENPMASPPDGYPDMSLVFYEGSYDTNEKLLLALASDTPPAVAFFLTGSSDNRISSNDIFQCANSLAKGGAAQKNVGKMIGAAFNRGVMVSKSGEVTNVLNDGTCATLSGTFYPSGGTYNVWSQLFHKCSQNKLAYGFPYDDVCNQNPSIPTDGQSLRAAFIRISLGKFYTAPHEVKKVSEQVEVSEV